MCLFWTILKERNRKVFENTVNVDQAITQTFIYIFLEWVRVHIGDCSSTMIDFIDWLNSKKHEDDVCFCASLCQVWPLVPCIHCV